MGGVVMKVCVELGPSRNLIVTFAIGADYMAMWNDNVRAGWEAYCRRHRLGLIVFDEELITRESPVWKKVHWQKTLLGSALRKAGIPADNVCFLDADILINPTAPDVFANHDPASFGLVSLRRNLPFPYHEVLRRMAFLRHRHYDLSYPLDSTLFMSVEQLYGYHDLPAQPDEACTGLIMFNLDRHAGIMEEWFGKYESGVRSITNGGEQTHLNYEIQNHGCVSWIDYRFQAIWPFEMAWKYPFLYAARKSDIPLVRACIEAALYQNHFLHFAGHWHESQMWKVGGFFAAPEEAEALAAYDRYLATPVTGSPVGLVRPG
jgi:hypothetical protein